MGATGKGELKAEAWLARHGDALFRYALRKSGTREAAEDLVQDTLLAAWQGRASFRGAASERTWLMAILKHKANDRLRKQYKAPPQTADGSSDDVENRLFTDAGTWRESPGHWGRDPLDDAQADAFLDVLTDCLERIPASQRESFVLRELGELDARESVAVMGITANHLYVLLHRARLQLRRCLERGWFGAGARS